MEKVTNAAIEKSITDTIVETFRTMMSLDVTAVKEPSGEKLDENRMVGAINFGGEVVGVVSVHLSDAFARLITISMLGIELDEIENDDDVKDVIGELSNIITGNLKSDFLDAGLSCVMSTPSITAGSDFKIDSADIAEPIRFYYKHNDFLLMVELCAKEEIGSKDAVGLGERGLSSEAIIDKINSVDIKTAVVNSVIDVFYTMLEMEVDAIQEVPDSFKEGLRTVGSVSFAGDVDGMFNIQVNDVFGKMMTAAMLGMEIDEVESEEEVFDVIRELSNIIGGNLKSTFVDAGLSCVLSTPSITNGNDFKVGPTNIINPERYLFGYGEHIIIVEAGVKTETIVKASEEETEATEEEVPGDTAAPAVTDEALDPSKLQNLDFLLNIPLDVTVELGRSKKRINDVLRLGPGSVVELEQLEGEFVDILVNKTLIAKGVVVVENDKYGIRIKEIISRKERIKSFG